MATGTGPGAAFCSAQSGAVLRLGPRAVPALICYLLDDAMVEPWCKSRIVPVTAAKAEASLPGSAGRQLQIARAIQATRFEAIAGTATEVVAMMDVRVPRTTSVLIYCNRGF